MLQSYQPMLPVLIKLFIDSDYSCIVILIFFKFFEFNLSTIFFSSESQAQISFL